MQFTSRLSNILTRSQYSRHFSAFRSTNPTFAKNKGSIAIIHQTQRSQEEDNIDFSALKLKFPMIKDQEYIVAKFLWSKPPDSLPNLPFLVERTTFGGLPVYTDIRTGRTRFVTILRNISGDVMALKDDMEKVVDAPVEVRPGKLIVRGNYGRRLKRWLTGLGF